jgi:ribosomal protein S26
VKEKIQFGNKSFVISVVICGRGIYKNESITREDHTHHTREIHGNSSVISLKSNNIFYSLFDLPCKLTYHGKCHVHKDIIQIHFIIKPQSQKFHPHVAKFTAQLEL